MKLRIADNSVRFRLGRSDVAQLQATGSVEAELRFANGSALVYRLIADARIETPRASFANATIEVVIPPHPDVDTSAVLDTDGGEPLTVLIERDFQCLHNEPGADVDTFPNPLQNVSF